MLILLPKDGQFGSLEKKLDAELVKAIISNLETADVSLTIPKIEYESSFTLKEALSKLDMQTAFSINADLSGVNGKRDLYIQDLLHKAFVSVDEAGTEAAATTAVILRTNSRAVTVC
jgi:serpin B